MDYEIRSLSPEQAAGLQQVADEFQTELITVVAPALKSAWFLAQVVVDDPQYSSELRADALKIEAAAASGRDLVKGLADGRLALAALQLQAQPTSREGVPEPYTLAVVNPVVAQAPITLERGQFGFAFLAAIPVVLILKTTIGVALSAGIVYAANILADAWRTREKADLFKQKTLYETAKILDQLPPDQAAAQAARINQAIADDESWSLSKWFSKAGKAVKAVATGAFSTALPWIALFILARRT